MDEKDKQQIIDLGKIARVLWNKKTLFYKVWAITFVLSCVWILPQPRYYISDVTLAPEMNSENIGGGLSSIASSFGFNLGGMAGQDAIYPELYPELFESPEFVVGLYDIQVTTMEGDFTANYFTYMKEHQKENLLTKPFRAMMGWVKGLFEEEDSTQRGTGSGDINPFKMNRKDFDLMQVIMANISCSVDKKTSVITITVKDQDPLVCATMADSVKAHLQSFIIRYRTSKVSEDVNHYRQMRDSAELAYDQALEAYSRFCDTHKDIVLQTIQSERDKLENDLVIRQNTLSAMEAQLQSAKVKMQEKTPAFTTLKSATVPVKPAGPKRMIFVGGLLFIAFLITILYIIKDDIFSFERNQLS